MIKYNMHSTGLNQSLLDHITMNNYYNSNLRLKLNKNKILKYTLRNLSTEKCH